MEILNLLFCRYIFAYQCITLKILGHENSHLLFLFIYSINAFSFYQSPCDLEGSFLPGCVAWVQDSMRYQGSFCY